MFNLFHDAVKHSKGENIDVTVGTTKNSLVFATTNVGRKLPPRVIKLIGERPYTTSSTTELKHGHGKVAAKGVVWKHGGKWLKGNAPKGFRLGFTLPRKPKRGTRAA
jgi:sensor histidine kinase regulating citrate/malate metabolism